MPCVFVLFAIKNKGKLDSYTIGSRQVLDAWLVSGHDSLQRHECTLFDSYPATFSVYRHVRVSRGWLHSFWGPEQGSVCGVPFFKYTPDILRRVGRCLGVSSRLDVLALYGVPA